MSINSGETLPLAAVAVASPGAAGRDWLAIGGDQRDAVALARKVLAEVGPAYPPLGEARSIDGLAVQLPNREADHHYLWWRPTPGRGRCPGRTSGRTPTRPLRVGPLFDRFFPGSYAKPGASAHR